MIKCGCLGEERVGYWDSALSLSLNRLVHREAGTPSFPLSTHAEWGHGGVSSLPFDLIYGGECIIIGWTLKMRDRHVVDGLHEAR